MDSPIIRESSAVLARYAPIAQHPSSGNPVLFQPGMDSPIIRESSAVLARYAHIAQHPSSENPALSQPGRHTYTDRQAGTQTDRQVRI